MLTGKLISQKTSSMNEIASLAFLSYNSQVLLVQSAAGQTASSIYEPLSDKYF